jgi:hypothetical protein
MRSQDAVGRRHAPGGQWAIGLAWRERGRCFLNDALDEEALAESMLCEAAMTVPDARPTRAVSA